MRRMLIVALWLVVLQVSGLSQAKWQTALGKSLMDDSKTVTLTLPAEGAAAAFLKAVRPVLVLRCREGKTEAYVHTGTAAQPELGAFEEYSVRLRFGTEKAVSQKWGEATSDEGLFSPEGRRFITHLEQVDALLFEFTPFSSNPAIVTFDVRGLSAKLPPLADACGWAETDRRIAQELADAEARTERARVAADTVLSDQRLADDALATEVRREAAGYGLLKPGTPLIVDGLSIPVPGGLSKAIITGSLIDITNVVADRRDFLRFFSAALQADGWQNDSSPRCWKRSSPTAMICIDVAKAFHSTLNLKRQ